jgi:peptidoglycan DL-endopeptidase CwlO
MTWQQVRDVLAGETYPRAKAGTLPLADRLEIGPASGAQAYLPMTASRMANATTIVRQALDKHMGLRSAVIAVATAMQESTLENLNYGDRDSLGLFQQRPSMGWGTPAQITDPAYAADAFLNALRAHQSADPAWAGQPLWENAQAVQESGFPYAYAKWENQAAQVVSSVARHLV